MKNGRNLNPPVDKKNSFYILQSSLGGLAQLGERLAGSQKVIGSIPLSSTCRNRHKKRTYEIRESFFLCVFLPFTTFGVDISPYFKSRNFLVKIARIAASPIVVKQTATIRQGGNFFSGTAAEIISDTIDN